MYILNMTIFKSISFLALLPSQSFINKNDNIKKNKFNKSDDQTNFDNRVDVNIKESIGQFWHAYINKSKKTKIFMLKMGILTVGNDYKVVLFS